MPHITNQKGEMTVTYSASRRWNGSARGILLGVLLAVAVTAGLVAAFALLISLFTFSDKAIRAVNQGIKLLAICLGARAAVPAGSANAVLRGALTGLIYMAAGVLVYALLSGQQVTAFSYLADLLLGLAVGGLVGMMRAKANE